MGGGPAAAAARFHHNHAIGRNGSFHFYVDQENDRAFVSLPGNDTVVQVALPGLQIEATFDGI